jgi:hypothetical protein
MLLQVQLNHGNIFFEDATVRQEMVATMARAHRTMAARCAQLVEAACLRPHILTAAVKRVLQRTPDRLDWQQLPHAGSGADTASFEAVCGGHLYSINVLDGTVRHGYQTMLGLFHGNRKMDFQSRA